MTDPGRDASGEHVLTGLVRRARERHALGVRRVRAQAGEPGWRTLARPLYLTACVLVDGPVLMEIVRAGSSPGAWLAYGLALAVAVRVQAHGYRAWFAVDPEAAERNDETFARGCP